MNEKDNENIFPNSIYIAYAVCSKECGYKSYIVDGSTQICPKCMHSMFRTEIKKYTRGEK